MKLTLNESTGEVRDEQGATFCYLHHSGYKNAAFIVRACNAHYLLLSIVEKCGKLPAIPLEVQDEIKSAIKALS